MLSEKLSLPATEILVMLTSIGQWPTTVGRHHHCSCQEVPVIDQAALLCPAFLLAVTV
jgi:hypothetical protein